MSARGLVTGVSRRYAVGADERPQLRIAHEQRDEEGWVVASVLEVPGALSQGRTRAEARADVIDALRLMLSPDESDPHVASGPGESPELILAG